MGRDRLKRAASMPQVREEGASGRFDQVAGTGCVTGTAFRGRSGAGLGDTLDAASRSTWLGAASNHQAGLIYPPVFSASMLMNSALRGQSLRNSRHTGLASSFFLNRFCRV
jgi:hypothetical protein